MIFYKTVIFSIVFFMFCKSSSNFTKSMLAPLIILENCLFFIFYMKYFEKTIVYFFNWIGKKYKSFNIVLLLIVNKFFDLFNKFKKKNFNKKLQKRIVQITKILKLLFFLNKNFFVKKALLSQDIGKRNIIMLFEI